MTTMMRAASEIGFTRMDLPLLLGTAFTDNRTAREGLRLRLRTSCSGCSSPSAYAFVFALGEARGTRRRLAGRRVHALFIATVLVNVLLPIVHPRMATPDTAADQVALIEPPGFLMLNYGRNTFLVTLAAHIAYGAIVGWACG